MKKYLYSVLFVCAFLCGMLNFGEDETSGGIENVGLSFFYKKVNAQTEGKTTVPNISKLVLSQTKDVDWDSHDSGTGPDKQLGCIPTTCPNGNMTCNISKTVGVPDVSFTHYQTYNSQQGSYTDHYEGSAVYGGGVTYDYEVTYNCDDSPVPGESCTAGVMWSTCQPCDLCSNDYNLFY